MFPYGLKPGEWRDEDCGPPSRCRKVKAKNRHESRRSMHKVARGQAKKALRRGDYAA